MKRLVFCTLLLAGLLMPALAVQQGAKPADTAPAKGNFVGDDDGGLTEIVAADPMAQGPRASDAAPVMKSVQQVSIFLGAGWGDQQVRSRQSRLLDLRASPANPALADFRNQQGQVLPAAPRVPHFSDL